MITPMPDLRPEEPVVGRGWLVEVGDRLTLVHTPDEFPDAGIPVVVPSERVDLAVRYTVADLLDGDTLLISALRPATRQDPPNMGEEELRFLGCAGQTP